MKTLSGPSVTLFHYTGGAFDSAKEYQVKLIDGKPRYKESSLEWVPIPADSRQHKISLDIHRQIN